MQELQQALTLDQVRRRASSPALRVLRNQGIVSAQKEALVRSSTPAGSAMVDASYSTLARRIFQQSCLADTRAPASQPRRVRCTGRPVRIITHHTFPYTIHHNLHPCSQITLYRELCSTYHRDRPCDTRSAGSRWSASYELAVSSDGKLRRRRSESERVLPLHEQLIGVELPPIEQRLDGRAVARPDGRKWPIPRLRIASTEFLIL